MPDRKFDLGDYVEVKDRIRLFYELYANGRLVTEEVQLSNEPDGVPRVLVKALAYRTPDDPHPAAGWSWMVLPGTTNYTRGSELENVETSAWGRAIAALGILVDKSIASAQEVQNKQDDGKKPQPPDEASAARLAGKDPGGIVGTIEESKAWAPNFEPKIDPVVGYFLEFKLVEDGRRGGIKTQVTGPLAEQLSEVIATGQRVTCWGNIQDVSFTNKADKKITYQVLNVDRITGPFGTLPVVVDRIPGEALANLPPGYGIALPLEEPEPVPLAEGQEELPL